MISLMINIAKIIKVKRIVLIVLLLITFILPIEVKAKETSDIVTLSSCVDAEQARFIRGVLEVKVKFIGIQPEERIASSDNDEINGADVKDYICSMLENAKEIKLEYEPSIDGEDKFGRIMAWVFVDGSLLQEETVKNGYARVMYLEDNYLYSDRMKSAQAYAKENKLGIWMEKEEVVTEEPIETKEEESKGIIEIIIDFFVSIFRKIKEFIDNIINNLL